MNLYIYYHQVNNKQHNISKLSGVLRIRLTQAVLGINRGICMCPFISRCIYFVFFSAPA